MEQNGHQEEKKPQVVITFKSPDSAEASIEFHNMVPGIMSAQLAIVSSYLKIISEENWKREIVSRQATSNRIVIPFPKP